MKITDVIISNFRSIEHARLNGCGDINVLIGKNNAGKSNILLAIATFFEFIQKGELCLLLDDPKDTTNFFQHHHDTPIDITIKFSLSISELERLRSYLPVKDHTYTTMSVSITNVQFQMPDHRFVNAIIMAATAVHSETEDYLIFAIGKEDRGTAVYTKVVIDELSAEALVLEQAHKKINESSAKDNISSLKVQLNNLIRKNPAHERLLAELQEKATSYTDLETALDEKSLLTDSNIKAMTKNLATMTGTNHDALPNIIYTITSLINQTVGEIHYLRERRTELGTNDATVFLESSRRRERKPSIKRFQEQAKTVLGVDIDAFVDEKNEPVLDVDTFLIQVNGYGVKEALRIIFDYETKRPKVVLIEEPELHLHPSFEINLMRYLKEISADCQIFMTTHSTNFIDTGDVKNVYLVSKHESTTVQPLNTEEAASRIPQELGLQLSSLFMYNKLIFVEGKLDEEILRVWATTLSVNLSQHNIGFVHMGGIKNYHYFAVEETLNFLSQKQVGVWFVADRDERGDDEIAALKAKLHGKATLCLLNRREIENYLFVPRAIAQFLREKGRASGLQATTDSITEEVIQQQLTTCVEACKQQVIEKRIAARLPALRFDREVLFPKKPKSGDLVSRSIQELERLTALISDAKTQFPAIAHEEAAAIEARWPTEKMNLVQGDVLLDAVFQVYGLRFNKSRDGAALAALMTEEEIDSEIKAFFKAITQ